MDVKFSPKQQSAIAAGLTLLAVVGIVWILFRSLVVLSGFFAKFSGVFLPLFTAGVFALMLKPYYRFWVNRCKCRPALAVTAVYLSFFVPLLLFLWLIGGIVFDQFRSLAGKLPALARELHDKVENLTPAVREALEQYQLADRARAIIQTNMDGLAQAANEVLSGLVKSGAGTVKSVTSILSWAVMPVYLAFLLTLRSREQVTVEQFLPFLKERTRRDVAYLAREFMNILVSFFRGQIVVALLQGLVYGALYALAGVKMGFVIGLVQGLLNVVPFMGTISGLFVAIPVCLMQEGGGVEQLVKWAVAFGVGQIVESYFITPKVMGETTGLHPMVIIFAIFFWGTALQGFVGIFLAIPLTAFVVVVWRLVKNKYMTEIV